MTDAAADVIIIPVHNRRETTLGALRALQSDDVFSWATVLVVDDGSTDGTAAAIASEHPRAELLRGDGSWWWAGAIRRGMAWALARGAQRLFWLNDDCRPPPGVLAAMRARVQQEECVTWCDARTASGWSYGGHRRTLWRVRRSTPNEEREGRIETFSGNCVCLPRRWIERVGLPDDHLFPHGIADLDYGLRLHAAGAPLRRHPGAIATNGDPSAASAERWLSSARSMRAIWADFRSPRSFLYFPAWRHFALRHWGPLWGVPVFFAPYVRWCLIALVRAVVPRRLLLRRARESRQNARLDSA